MTRIDRLPIAHCLLPIALLLVSAFLNLNAPFVLHVRLSALADHDRPKA
jgi:hypothetical protein